MKRAPKDYSAARKDPRTKKRHPDATRFDGLKQLRESKPPYLAMFEHPDPSKLNYSEYPFGLCTTVLILGEIENMPGHVALLTRDGRLYWGYHAENFRKLAKLEA